MSGQREENKGLDGRTSSYEIMKFTTHSCQSKKVRDREMADDENEDIGW